MTQGGDPEPAMDSAALVPGVFRWADLLRRGAGGALLVSWVKWLVRQNPFRLAPAWLQRRMVARSGLFDEGLHAADSSPASSGRGSGIGAFVARGGSCCALFDASWYAEHYGINGSYAELLLHYAYIGDHFGLKPSIFFDPYIVRLNPGFPGGAGSSLVRYLRAVKDDFAPNGVFDSRWYRSAYADVAASGDNALVHFALHGHKEGRSPSGHFDPAWYRETYPDVAASGIDPVVHYLRHGAEEQRKPGPDFDPVGYARRYLRQPVRRVTPLAHYLAIGRHAGHTNGQRSVLSLEDLAPSQPASLPLGPGTVDVVLPVYRGFEETRACVESVLASSNRTRIRLHVTNDASPESQVTHYLRERFAGGLHDMEVILRENPHNLGFVRTVNAAMRAALSYPDSMGALLLNSDTIVYGDWVDRMVAHALGQQSVASVTALSNNATICSYPVMGGSTLPADVKAEEVDATAASVNAGANVDVPTGVGFCMFITRRALETVGVFDEEAFGRGYGEENDFCRRASMLGLRNLLALDVFVVHVGEVSFSADSHKGKQAADAVIRSRYPDYHTQVAAFVAEDPALKYRLKLTFGRWRVSGSSATLLITHGLGGGTERHVQDRARDLSMRGNVVVMRPVQGYPDRVLLENPSGYDGFKFELHLGGVDGLAHFVRLAGIQRLEIHQVIGYGPALREWVAETGLPFDFTTHDYFTVCPQVSLTRADSTYCGEPDERGCDACIRKRPTHGAVDIRNWRAAQSWLVQQARVVNSPSRDAAKRIARYFGREPKVLYNEESPVFVPHAVRRKADPLTHYRVTLLGVLAGHKGRALVLDAAAAARRRRLPLTFMLIGDPQGAVPADASHNFTSTGWYEEADLVQLIRESRTDCFLFASTVPETFSYTLTAAMRTGMPIIATDIGAFPERLESYPLARLVPPCIDGEALAAVIVAYMDMLAHRGGESTLLHSAS